MQDLATASGFKPHGLFMLYRLNTIRFSVLIWQCVASHFLNLKGCGCNILVDTIVSGSGKLREAQQRQ